jgi:UDP-N-acetylmuramyl pentapeptide phosphotransferase/UDP-N-acetylglucosamine-1-phosphate transferase
LIDFLIAGFSILLALRNPSASPWFEILVNAYPIFETIFTFKRRKMHREGASLPDGVHFQLLIQRRLIRWAEIHKVKGTASYAKNAKISP